MPTKEEEELNFRNDAIRTIKSLSEENTRLKSAYGRSRSRASRRESAESGMPRGLATLGNPLGNSTAPKTPYKKKGGFDLSDLM
jgi:hypothetical protein